MRTLKDINKMILNGKLLFFCIVINTIVISSFGQDNVFNLKNITQKELSEKIQSKRLLAVLCISPLEQHGLHLPLGTDIMISEYLAKRVTENFLKANLEWNVVQVPSLNFSPNYASLGFTGNTNTSINALYETLILTFHEFYLSGIKNVLIIDNHLQPEAQTPIDEAISFARENWGIKIMQPLAAIIFDDGFRKKVGDYFDNETEKAKLDLDIHAGFLETSMMLYIHPESVNMKDLTSADSFPLSAREFGMHVMLGKSMKQSGSKNGSIGLPANASVDFGKHVTEQIVEYISDACQKVYIENNSQVLKERRTWFRRIPMQGSKYMFPFFMPDGTTIDGFIPAIALVGQSTGNIGITSFIGYGTTSEKLVNTTRMVISRFFFNNLEQVSEFSNLNSIQRISVGFNYYFGFVQPDLFKRPSLRVKSLCNVMNAYKVKGNNYFNTDTTISSFSIALEYNPQLNMPFSLSELNLGYYEPYYFLINYDNGSKYLKGVQYDKLEVDTRIVKPIHSSTFKLSLRNYFSSNSIFYRANYLPDQLYITGNSSKNFRGYADYKQNLFSKILMQSIEIRYLRNKMIFPLLSGVGFNLSVDYGWGEKNWDKMFTQKSYRMSACLGFMFQFKVIPFYFRQDFASPIYGKEALNEFNSYFGIGYAF